jgi:hypothetical protein
MSSDDSFSSKPFTISLSVAFSLAKDGFIAKIDKRTNTKSVKINESILR